jgi:hypothetical protein
MAIVASVRHATRATECKRCGERLGGDDGFCSVCAAIVGRSLERDVRRGRHIDWSEWDSHYNIVEMGW